MGTGSGPPSPYIMQHNLASGLDAGNLPGGGSVNVNSSSSNNPSGSAGLFGSSLSKSEPPNLDRFDQQETLQHQRQKIVLPSQLSEKHQQQSQQVHQRYQQHLFQPAQPPGQRQGLGSAQDIQEQQVMRLRTMQQFQGRTFDSMGGSSQHVRPAQPLTYLQLEASATDRLVSDQDQQQQILVRKAETKIGDDMQHQVLQHGLKRPYSMLSPHLLSQESLKLQRQTPQQFQVPPNLLQQRLLQRQQQLQLLAQHLRQEQHQSQHQSHQQFTGVQTLPSSKHSAFEPGACARRLMQYMYHQRHRPSDNNIGFWRKFVAEYFVPSAKKRWCVSQYGSADRLPTGVFPQDVWQCEICGSKPSRGFETSVEILPRLCKIKYDSGILEDLLFVDLPHEYRLNSGVVVLEYGKAIQESVFEQLRVVRDGQLRITFSHDLKILSWEFCARSHEELLSRRSILPQVTQLAGIAQKYQTSVKESGDAGLPLHDLQSSCQSFVASSRHLARNLEVPTVNDFGYTKRYVRCLQISEVVNSMKDLIDFSRENGMGPIACLQNFPRVSSTRLNNSSPQQQDQLSLPALVSEEKNTSSSEQCNDNENEDLASGLDATVSDLGSEANVPQDLPRLGHQNSISSLEMSFQNTASKPFATDLSDKLMHCTEMDSANYGSSLQTSFSASGTPESSIMSNLSTSGHQNPLNSSANLLQHRSSQSHIAQHASDNPAHTFKELMLNPQGNNGGQFEQMLGRITTSSSGNGGIGCSVGGFINGLRRSDGLQIGAGKVENNMSYGQTGIGKVENNIGFVGHRNTNILGRSYGSLTNGGGNLLTGLGGSMRNGGSGISAIGNSNFMNGARTFPSVDQHQYIQLQNPGIELQDNIARNGLFNNVGSSGGFGNLQFS